MKPLKYFLQEENKYNESHNGDNITLDFGEESGGILWDAEDELLYFLRKRPFEKYSKASLEHIDETSKYGLSPIERTILSMFYGDCSAEFRDDLYRGCVPIFVMNMMEVLDSVVRKAPTTKHNILYRFCHDSDKIDMEEDEDIVFAFNLTCTADNWAKVWPPKESKVYIVYPLQNEFTRGHDLYKIYNKANEKQVDFLRNTKFKVAKVKNLNDIDSKLIYLNELPNI